MSDDDPKIPAKATEPEAPAAAVTKMDPKVEERIRMLAKVVCICKGINLGRVLKVLDRCETVEDVNRLAGTGSGGCKGERCGPRIKLLLKKKKEAQKGRP